MNHCRLIKLNSDKCQYQPAKSHISIPVMRSVGDAVRVFQQHVIALKEMWPPPVVYSASLIISVSVVLSKLSSHILILSYKYAKY